MRGTTFASVGAEGIYERLYPFVSLSGTSGANGCHIKYPSYADAMSILAYLYATWQAFIDKRNFRVLLSVFEFIGVIAYILYVAKFVGLFNRCKSAMPIGWGSDHACRVFFCSPIRENGWMGKRKASPYKEEVATHFWRITKWAMGDSKMRFQKVLHNV